MVKYTRIYRKKYCLFCKDGGEISYKDPETLRKFTTERCRIMSRARSGACAAHQRKVSTAVKRARILALLPFCPKI